MSFTNWTNRRNQNIGRYGSVRVADWIPEKEAGSNLAVFGGNILQRTAVVEQGIARCFGKMGIVVIHNNSMLEKELMGFRDIYPEIFHNCRSTGACFINSGNLCYEPLFGLDRNRALEVIYPELSTDSPMYLQQHLCADALRKYFEIFQYKKVPVNLDDLLYLTNLDIDVLESKELRELPPEAAADILAVLVQENIMRQVRADVNHFADRMDGRIWSRNRKALPVSIIEAVKRRALISVRISSANPAVMDYLSSELNYLMDHNAAFLLVIDSVNIGNSIMKSIAASSGDGFSTVLAGNSISDLFDASREDGDNALFKAAKIILFQCANAAMAKQYSELIGNYLRQFTSISDNQSRGAFDLFSGHGKGKSITEQDYARIRPEELVHLGNGAVLINQMNGKIETVKKIIF